MFKSDRFKDQVAIVTGAASGIGLETAKRLGQEGAKIVLVDFDQKKLNHAEGLLAELKIKTWACLCDVSNSDDVANCADDTMKKFGQINLIVNNAGLMVFKPLEEQVTADWIKVLGVDLLGSFYFIKQGFLHMKPGSSIVNVSSIHAVETTPLVASYAAAKAALLSLTRSASIEGKPKGIRVNAVLPGAIDTPMLWDNPNIKAGLEVIKQTDVGKAEDIASAIAYLASPDSGFIQGSSLRVDGGRLAQL